MEKIPVADFRSILVEDGFLEMITIDGTAKDDVKLPEGEIGQNLQAAFDKGTDLLVTIISSMGIEQANSYKESPVRDLIALHSD